MDHSSPLTASSTNTQNVSAQHGPSAPSTELGEDSLEPPIPRLPHSLFTNPPNKQSDDHSHDYGFDEKSQAGLTGLHLVRSNQSLPETYEEFSTSDEPHPAIRKAPTAPDSSAFVRARGMKPGGFAQFSNQYPHDLTHHPGFNSFNSIGREEQGLPLPSGARTPAETSRPPIRELLLVPEKKRASDAGLTWKVACKNIITASWLNVMLIFIPVSWACHFAFSHHQSDTLVFVTSFLAIVPLASLLGFATEEISLRVGQSLGGLLNATFGNAVELLISILALVKGELDIVRSSMLGSILSNTLLVLGCCFVAGGLRFHEQGYGVRAAQLNISLLGISMAAIIIPTAYHFSLGEDTFADPEGKELKELLSISRGTAFLLLIVYAGYLTFQLYTHAYLFKTVTPFQRRKLESQAPSALKGPLPPGPRVFPRPHWVPSLGSSSSGSSIASSQAERARRGSVSVHTDAGGEADREAGSNDISTVKEEEANEEEEEVLEVPKLTTYQALAMLLVVTAITGVTAEWLVGSIDGMTQSGNISREFVSLILLPLVGNAAEHVSAVMVSIKDKIDLSLSIAVGSSIQIALFVIPTLVLLAWAIGQPLTMKFDLFEVSCLFITVLIVNYAIQDDKTNYMEGLILIVVYFIIALVTWFYPGAAAIAASRAADAVAVATSTAT
ncbi:Ca2 /H antiporter VCX1 and related proteins [Phaffia rhodozyma]|uniref:Ca2 /H antiporter VCX1 and related proteins n=1 Tax=Phaffia rhodozyma TaxID=264483 RepID=A0A0F7SEL4_PHARH|nr:Ca2 /H antiporter VCX1 and related proteins [Phaffia rhodozyma]